MAKKEKKEKTVWVDDGRSFADMSQVGGPRLGKRYSTSTAKEKWDTYWAAVKMMFVPMLTVITALGVIYLVLYFIMLLTY